MSSPEFSLVLLSPELLIRVEPIANDFLTVVGVLSLVGVLLREESPELGREFFLEVRPEGVLWPPSLEFLLFTSSNNNYPLVLLLRAWSPKAAVSDDPVCYLSNPSVISLPTPKPWPEYLRREKAVLIVFVF